MSRNLHSKILEAIGDRQTWETRQRLWYQMRHDGIPRRRKPFEGAADLHYPMADTAIDKFKPFYLNSAFGTQLLATFTPMSPQLGEAQGAAEQAFDWLTRNRTNFEQELDSTFDAMLMSGRTTMKARWDAQEKAVEYESVDPMFFIVPKSTTTLNKAPWLCHVKQLSIVDYEMESTYNQDPSFIARIKGGQEDKLDAGGKEQEKSQREGITYSDDDSIIILFEVYVRDAQGWIIHTFSPSEPDTPVRKPFRCPYKFQGKPLQPFVSFQFEVKDRGYYAPRGVCERLAPYEAYANKCWNTKADSMEFVTKPLFTADNPLANTNNIRFRPGDFIPGIKAVEMPRPPISLDEEINNTRLIAQENIQVPDFGASDQGTGESKTATEMNYVASFSGQGIQYRGRIAARSLADAYRLSWALWVMYGGEELSYFAAETRKVLPAQARHDNYLIAPNGSPDQWNRQQRLQRAVSRFQMFRGHPNINQEELVKSILEEDDPRLIKRLFITTSAKQANEKEDEAVEILLLMSGYPAAVSPGEDHQLRIRLIAGKLQQLSAVGAPVDPIARQRLQEHMAAHIQMLKQENPAVAKQFVQAISALDLTPSPDGAAMPGTPPPPLPGDSMGPGQGMGMGMGMGAPDMEGMAV